MFRPIAAIFRFWQFSAKRVLYNMPKSNFIVVFLTEFTSPYSLNAQRGWHTSEHEEGQIKEICIE